MGTTGGSTPAEHSSPARHPAEGDASEPTDGEWYGTRFEQRGFRKDDSTDLYNRTDEGHRDQILERVTRRHLARRRLRRRRAASEFAIIQARDGIVRGWCRGSGGLTGSSGDGTFVATTVGRADG